jgi:rhodanese-related sulfurtransferase
VTEDEDIELGPARVAELIEDDGWQVIDIREPHERVEARIAGTRHIPLASLTEQADTIDRERPVLFYCHVGNRSTMALRAFRASGYDARHLEGGIEAWVAAGLPVEQGDE